MIVKAKNGDVVLADEVQFVFQSGVVLDFCCCVLVDVERRLVGDDEILAFARGANRDDVYKGAEELGVPLDEHIAFCVTALRSVAPDLGLNGVGAAASS